MSEVKQAQWDQKRRDAAALGVTLAEYLKQERAAKKTASVPIVPTQTGRRMKD